MAARDIARSSLPSCVLIWISQRFTTLQLMALPGSAIRSAVADPSRSGSDNHQIRMLVSSNSRLGLKAAGTPHPAAHRSRHGCASPPEEHRAGDASAARVEQTLPDLRPAEPRANAAQASDAPAVAARKRRWSPAKMRPTQAP
jgi:hypothetical protein